MYRTKFFAVVLVVLTSIVFGLGNIANGQNLEWTWQDSISPVNPDHVELIQPQQCEGVSTCQNWNTNRDGPGYAIEMDVKCPMDGVSMMDGEVVNTVHEGRQTVLAFTARPCPPEETQTPNPTEVTSTATPVPTETVTITVTPSPTATATVTPTATATPSPTKEADPEPTETATPKPTATPRPWAENGWMSIIRPMNGEVELNVLPCEEGNDCWNWSAFEEGQGHAVMIEARCELDGSRLVDDNVEEGIIEGENLALGFTARPCPEEVFLPNVQN